MKKDERDSTRPDFWSERYVSGRTPWQLDHLPARLALFVESLPAGSNVLIPGCGEDSKTIDAFRRAGHQLTVIDFSPVAIEHVKNAVPELRERTILGNFFTDDLGDARFDLVYERTFLCSLPPRLWSDYVGRVAKLLRPHGLLAGFFYYGKESDPPPYPLIESKASELFDARVDLLKSDPVSDSLSIFAGQEKWQEWQLRA